MALDEVRERELTVRKIIQSVGDLPAAPAILEKAIRLTSDLDSNIKDISHSVSMDQSISANVIRVANSPVYGRKNKVTKLSEAIQVLGFNEVKSIVLTATTFNIFGNCDHVDLAMKLWHHSFSTAIAARIIAQRLTGLDKEAAYLSGLMHDIGKLILLNIAPGAYLSIINTAKESRISFVKQEEIELGFNHAELGGLLLSDWNVDRPVVKAVTNHHLCDVSQPAPSEQLERVVEIANAISKYIGADFYEPYEEGFKEIYYIGASPIEGDALIMIQCDTESQFMSEMNLLLK